MQNTIPFIQCAHTWKNSVCLYFHDNQYILTRFSKQRIVEGKEGYVGGGGVSEVEDENMWEVLCTKSNAQDFCCNTMAVLRNITKCHLINVQCISLYDVHCTLYILMHKKYHSVLYKKDKNEVF